MKYLINGKYTTPEKFLKEAEDVGRMPGQIMKIPFINKEEDKGTELICQSKWFIDMLIEARIDKVLKECKEGG